MAEIHSGECSSQRARKPSGLRIFSKCLRFVIGALSDATANSHIAASESNLPAATSNSDAIAFRVFQSSRTTAM